MGIYHFTGVPMLRMMTSDVAVVEQSKAFLPWLLLMPVIGCAAFTWDGIYIGATASKEIRNAMLWAVVAFVAVWVAGMSGLGLGWFGASPDPAGTSVLNQTADLLYPGRYGILAMHILMAAYFAHLFARTIYLSVRYPRIFDATQK